MKPFLPFAVLFAISCLGCSPTPVATQTDSASVPASDSGGDAESNSVLATGTVTMEIRWGEGDSPPPWQREIQDVADGVTLESVMRQITDIEIDFSGAGDTAFIQSIGDQKTTAGKGWTFKIDDEFANQGIGQTILHPPCKVTWSYGNFEG